LGKKLPEKLIRYGAALIFLVSGVFTLAEAGRVVSCQLPKLAIIEQFFIGAEPEHFHQTSFGVY